MKRRDFLSTGLGASLFAGTLGSLGSFRPSERLLGSGLTAPALPYDLVAVMGGEPADMFDKAIAAMGGMQAFVKKNQTVVVKPNIGWDKTPEMGANTNPLLVKRIIEHCFKAGAREVYVFDNTCNEWQSCYRNSGIEKAVKDAGGKIVPGNTESYYHDVVVSKGKVLKKAKEHELILGSDVFINVPILKNHGGGTLTVSMKNMMGIVWDRRYWHANDLHQCIADYATYRQPDLNVVDAYRVMKKNGPQGVSASDLVLMKSLYMSPNLVTADAAAAKLFGIDPATVGHIRMASEAGVGSMDLQKQRINKIKMGA